jgi:hypothetical protein
LQSSRNSIEDGRRSERNRSSLCERGKGKKENNEEKTVNEAKAEVKRTGGTY